MSVKKMPPEARAKQVRKAMAHYFHAVHRTHSSPKQTQHSTHPNQNISRAKQVRKAMAHYFHAVHHTHSSSKQTQHSTHPNQNISRAQQGSVLVEVLVAAIIFAVALFALTSFQANVYRAHAVTGQQDIALELAQSQMQTFRNYTQLTTTTGQFAYADITSSSSTSTSVAGASYAMAWTVTDATNPTRKIVRVTVTWNDSTGAANTVNADSIIASIDPKLTGQVSQTLP